MNMQNLTYFEGYRIRETEKSEDAGFVTSGCKVFKKPLPLFDNLGSRFKV